MTFSQRTARFPFLPSLLAVAIVGCASQPTTVTPDWVTQPPKNEQFVYGVGSAPLEENIPLAYQIAENQGNGQIAQQLQAQVTQKVETQTRHTSDGNDAQLERNNQRFTQVTSKPLELTYIQNEARYEDGNYVYALQALDKYAAKSDLTHQLIVLEDEILEHAKQLPNTKDVHWTHWKNYFQWIPLFEKRDALVEKYQRYTQSSYQSANEDRIKKIQNLFDKAIAELSFYTDDKNLAAALADQGLAVTGPSQAFFVIFDNKSFALKMSQGRYYQFIDGSIDARTKTDQHGTVTIAARGIATNDTQAMSKAREDWGVKGAEGLFNWLIQ